MGRKPKKKIAVIGGGIAGLTAAYQLSKQHDVTVFEASSRIGGNAYGYTTHDGENIDIAVAAFGRAGYPNFYALLSEIGISTRLCLGSFMTFYNLDSKEGLFITPRLRALQMQDFDVLNPKHFKSFFNMFLGLQNAEKLLGTNALQGLTLGQWLDQTPEFDQQARLIFLCALCLLSSMSCPEVLATPAVFFIEKLAVHHDVLSPKATYSVRCVEQGTRRYISALASSFLEHIVLNSKIKQVLRSDDKATLLMNDGERLSFDAVVLACNADQALDLLAEPTELERKLLGAWKYKEGKVVLHRDHSSFPPRRLTQAYTFLYTDRQGRLETSVNGALWHLPSASPTCEYISSQHPNFPIRQDLIELETVLRTPMFDSNSIATRSALDSLNGIKNSYYCGSHFGFGLHEDAVRSALRCAELLGVPFVAKAPTPIERASEFIQDMVGLTRRWKSRFI